MPKSKLVTIFGGSGFVGRYITQRMAQAGWRVRVATRHPNDAIFVRQYGVVGQIEPIFCNIRDDGSVRDATNGADAVVNCVGILAESGKNTFAAIQKQGAARIARAAADLGVPRLVQISAIGADPESRSEYARTKAAGEAAIREAFPEAVILRPSIVFGPEDEFFNRFANMARFSPILPVVGGGTRFQPVYVDDVARAAALAVMGKAEPGIYELGGPDVNTFRELMGQMQEVIRRRRFVVGIPFPVAAIMGRAFDLANRLSFGLIPAQITADQVANLRTDNVVGTDVKTFVDLGLEPISMEAVLPDYLWRFRPSGQYSTIKESASSLRPR